MELGSTFVSLGECFWSSDTGIENLSPSCLVEVILSESIWAILSSSLARVFNSSSKFSIMASSSSIESLFSIAFLKGCSVFDDLNDFYLPCLDFLFWRLRLLFRIASVCCFSSSDAEIMSSGEVPSLVSIIFRLNSFS